MVLPVLYLYLTMTGMGANLVVRSSAEIEAVQKPLNNNSLPSQSKSRAQGVETGELLWTGINSGHLLLLCLYPIPLLHIESSLCFFALLFLHTTDNGRLFSIHRLMENLSVKKQRP